MSLREDVSAIKATLEAMEKRQDNWFKLLQERIPKWDGALNSVSFLMKAFWIIFAGLIGVIFKVWAG